MKKSKYVLISSVLLFVYLSGCINSSNAPTGITAGNAGTVTIISPISNDTVGIKGTVINYTVNSVLSNQSVELYVDRVYNSTYFTTLSNSTPLSFSFDTTKIGSRFSYYLKSYDSNGGFALSDTMKNILIIKSNTKLYKPTDVKLNLISNTELNISWKDSSSGITSYEVERKVGNIGVWTNLFGTLPSSTFNVNDKTINLSVSNYSYRIRGKNNFGYSEYSDSVNISGSGGGGSGSLGQPILSSVLQTNLPSAPPAVTLTWYMLDPSANYFNIERSSSISSNPEFIKTFISNLVFLYIDKSVLTPGVTYNYNIKAYSNTDSSWSNTKSVLIK